MRHLQTHLSRIFGGCGKAKAGPAEYLIEWPDGSRTTLAKNGSMWWFKAPDGMKYGYHYQQTAKIEITVLGGKIMGKTNFNKGEQG